MKIAFLCSSLEPGRDGVGDYCRRLGSALIELGHEILLVALHDRCVEQPTEEVEPVPVHRLPASDSLDSRLNAARQVLRRFQPDRLSLQYVCYGYHPKGLPWRWNRVFRELAREAPQRHIMFHELWVGDFPGAPFKHRILGKFQRALMKRLFRVFNPSQTHTSIPAYAKLLQSIGIPVKILLLFSNIPVISPLPDRAEVLALLKTARIFTAPRETYLLGLHFGTWHTDADPLPFLQTLAEVGRTRSLHPCIAAVGRMGDQGAIQFSDLEKLFAAEISFITLGPQPPDIISELIQEADFGLNTGFQELLGKSGSFAAMVAHGLPVMTFSGGPQAPAENIDAFRACEWEDYLRHQSANHTATQLLEAMCAQSTEKPAMLVP